MWSRKFEKCVNCGTTDYKHRANGLCIYCYQIENERRQKRHNKKPGLASKILTKEYLVEHYLNKKQSLGDIAKECGCTRQFVHKKIKTYQIPLRTKSSARELAYRDKKLIRAEFDRDFFSSWTQEMAWVLGVIYSDGNILSDQKNKTAYIIIAQKDPELLMKVNGLLNSDAKLRYQPERINKNGIVAGKLYILRLHSHKLYGDLIKLGLKPNKSLTIQFPALPSEYVRHFIRGCWDGDGSVYIEKRNNVIKASFVCGSLYFIKGMLNELEKAGLPKRTIYITPKRKNPSYYFRFSHSQCKQLYHYLYEDVPRDQYLKRKYDVFKKYFGYGISTEPWIK